MVEAIVLCTAWITTCVAVIVAHFKVSNLAREEVKKAIEEQIEPKWSIPEQPFGADTNVGGNLIEMPQVVRCKDCKWWHYWNGECYGNGNMGYGVGRKADDFCSWGERRKNAAD